MAARSERRRLLPAWMGAARGDEPGPAVAAPGAGRRRQRQRQRAAGTEPRAATVYCMNEAELVDVALGVLAENLQYEGAEEKACSGSEEEQELQPRPSNAPGSAASAGRGSNCSPGLPSAPDAGVGANAERTVWEDSEDDVLKYVREIFFT